MTDLRATLADLVADLVDPYVHAETIHLRSAIPDGRATQEIRIHRTRHPSLLDQLAAAVEPSGSAGKGARGYESSPVARIAAIDLLRAIETRSAALLVALGHKRRLSAAANLRALVGIEIDDAGLRKIIGGVRGWVTWARLVTAWDAPAIRPRATCGACEARGSLRVRLDPISAVCGACGASWSDEAEVAMLARHIRWCNGETETETEGVAA